MIIALSVVVSALSMAISGQPTGHSDDAERASAAASFSSDVTVFSSSGVRYLDGDIYRGSNYLYAFADEYKNPANTYLSRSVDGESWSSTTVMSGLNYAHGGFCVYTAGSSDHVIVSGLGYVRKSVDNGTTFSSLASLGATLDYTGVATNASMDPSRPCDNDIYVAGNIGITGIYLRKSIDNGASWSPSYTIFNSQSICPLFMRNDSRLYCFYIYDVSSDRNVYVKNSSDWGKTWGSSTKVFTKTQYSAGPSHVQYIDEARCLLTISDYASPTYSLSRGLYGYFWYSNSTFQQLGVEAGSAYNGRDVHSYSGIASEDASGVNYTSFWSYHVDSTNCRMKTHYSHDTGINLSSLPVIYLPSPAILNSPSTSVGLGVQYSFNASATLADNGSSTWSILRNASWLSKVWNDGTHCLVQGTPSSCGSYWVNLTVSDSNSSDYVNWTITVRETTPPTCTILTPATDPVYTSVSPYTMMTGTASDNIGVTSVTWTNSLGGSGTATGTTSWAIPSITIYAGLNLITVTAHDATGNTGSDTVTITQPPEISCTITTPGSSPINVWATPYSAMAGVASSSTGVTSVTWTNSRGGSGTATGTTSWTISSIPLSVGSNGITVVAHDALGNTGTDWTEIVYNPAPSCTITSPVINFLVYHVTNNMTVMVSGVASDNTGVTGVTWEQWVQYESPPASGIMVWSQVGGGTANGTNSWSFSVGLYDIQFYHWNEIRVKAWDSGGAYGQSIIDILYDDASPTCTIESIPFSPYYTPWSPVDLYGSATDDTGVTNVTWYNSATNASGTAAGLEDWHVTVPLIAGENPITITATDAVGNNATDSIVVGYDNISPTCNVTWPTVTPYYTNASSILITGTANDNLFISYVAVETYYYSTSWEAEGWYPYEPYFGCGASGTVNWSFNLPLSMNTKYLVSFYAYDGTEMFSGEDSVMIIRDGTSPTCVISSPLSDPYLSNSSTIDINGTATDSINVAGGFGDELLHGQVANVTWHNSATGGSGAASITPGWSIGWSLEDIPLANGDNLITITACDLAGNTGSDTLTVTYNPMDCFITSPTDSPTMATSWHMIYLRGNASDDEKVTSVTWINSLGGSGIAYMTPQYGAACVTWQSRGNVLLYNGDNVITVTSFDADGNTATDTLTVTYMAPESAPPTVTITDPTSSSNMTTGWHMIYLKGTATDNFKVTSVTWTNSLGGSGIAYMTPQYGGPSVNWQSRGNIMLYPGDNVITVTATDSNGNTAIDVLTVTYTGA